MTYIHVTPIDKELHRKKIAQLVEEARDMSPDNVAEYLVDRGLAYYEEAFVAGVEAAINSINVSESPYLRSYLENTTR